MNLKTQIKNSRKPVHSKREPNKKNVASVNELEKLIKEKKTILIASIKNIPASQFQEIVKKLRGKAVVKVPKKSIIFRALDESGKETAEKLKGKLDDSFAILFSDWDGFDLALELVNSKSLSKAKVGQEAPEDIEVQPGPTDLVPGPAISELGALGIQIQIDKGKIAIKEPRVIVRKGQKISQGAADVMNKLDIKPFTIGFIPLCAYDNKENKFYSEININPEKTIVELKWAHGKALPFAVSIGYISKDTIGFLLGKAGRQAKKINRILTGEPEEVIESPSAPAAETPKEETKEEHKEASGEGLASLFG